MLFNIERHLCLGRLDELAEMIDIAELGMKDRFQDWGKWFEAQTEGCSEDEKQDFVDHYYDDLAMVRDTAPNLMRRALFVMAIALLEKVVADLCRLLSRVGAVAEHPPSRLYLQTSKMWLTKYARFPESLFGSEWKACLRAEALRHAIVHNGGCVPNASANMKKDIRNTIGLAKWHIYHSDKASLGQFGDIMMEQGFCEDALKQARTAYETLLRRGEKLAAKVGKES